MYTARYLWYRRLPDATPWPRSLQSDPGKALSGLIRSRTSAGRSDIHCLLGKALRGVTCIKDPAARNEMHYCLHTYLSASPCSAPCKASSLCTVAKSTKTQGVCLRELVLSADPMLGGARREI